MNMHTTTQELRNNTSTSFELATSLKDDDIATLSNALRRNRSVTTLDLSRCHIDAAATRVLVDRFLAPNHDVIDAGDDDDGGDTEENSGSSSSSSASSFASRSSSSTTHANDAFDDDVAAAARLATLNLSYNDLGNDGVAAVCDALRPHNASSVENLHGASSVESLLLVRTGFSDDGAFALGDLLYTGIKARQHNAGVRVGQQNGDDAAASLNDKDDNNDDGGDDDDGEPHSTAVPTAAVVTATAVHLGGGGDSGAGVIGGSGLRHLNVSMNDAGAHTPGFTHFCDALAAHPTLTSLNVSRSALTCESWLALAAALTKNVTLTLLRCGFSEFLPCAFM
jgi:hypothetical protein